MDFPTQTRAYWSKHVLDIILSIFFIAPSSPPHPQTGQGIRCKESVFSHLGEKSEVRAETSNAKDSFLLLPLFSCEYIPKVKAKHTKAGSALWKPFVSGLAQGQALAASLPPCLPASATRSGGCSTAPPSRVLSLGGAEVLAAM